MRVTRARTSLEVLREYTQLKDLAEKFGEEYDALTRRYPLTDSKSKYAAAPRPQRGPSGSDMSARSAWSPPPPSDQLVKLAGELLTTLEAFAAAADVPDRAQLLRRLVGLRTDDLRRFVKHEGMEPWASLPLLTFCFMMHHFRLIRAGAALPPEVG